MTFYRSRNVFIGTEHSDGPPCNSHKYMYNDYANLYTLNVRIFNPLDNPFAIILAVIFMNLSIERLKQKFIDILFWINSKIFSLYRDL